MDLPKYNGTVHPEEWLKQIQIYCYSKGNSNVLFFCKLMIDSTITIPNEINSFEELIKALKSHSTFEIFKNTCKVKLKSMKYIPEKDGGNTATFFSNFRLLYKYAEINDIEETKNLLLITYSNEYFITEFAKRVNGLNSIDEMLILFSDIVFEEYKLIKHGSYIALKHVATGKYLSSCNVNYQTGSCSQLVSIFFFFI